jgi:hypothetical protein
MSGWAPRLRALGAPLTLAGARARRRPARWLLCFVGIAVATAFASAVLGEGTVVSDRAAQRELRSLSALQRTVRVTWSGGVTASIDGRARSMLADAAPGSQTRVVALHPVALGRDVVTVAAVEPLRAWARVVSGQLPVGACLAARCPVLLVSGPPLSTPAAVAGAHLAVVGSGRVQSPVPLGYVPGSVAGTGPGGRQLPLVLSGDVDGVERLPGLGGVYRTHTWLVALDVGHLQAWDLDGLIRRLTRVQAQLLSTSDAFTLTAPLDGLLVARDRARGAPRRLLLAGGGALAALAAFILLAAGTLRRDLDSELERLSQEGAGAGQRVLLAVGEAAVPSTLGVLAGFLLGVVATAVIAHLEAVPAGAVLDHSLLSAHGLELAGGAWVLSTALLAGSLLARDRAEGLRAGDAVALAAALALAVALLRGEAGTSPTDPLPLLLAPLSCVVAGVLVLRMAGVLLRGAERATRRGPVGVRLALVGAARAPRPVAGAIAFLAVCTGLGGFALAYRTTLTGAAADQAADRVPLDVTVTAGPSFVTPLQVASAARWHALSGGAVLPIRRTEASAPRGAGFATVPALGVPASRLTLIHGWRNADGSAPLGTLARRLSGSGPVRVPGPELGAGARSLSIPVSSSGDAVDLEVVLRDRAGGVRVVTLGTVNGPGRRLLRAGLPPGSWELEALELQQTAGAALIAGHQNAENVAAATGTLSVVVLGPPLALDSQGRRLGAYPLAGWTGRGSAAAVAGRGVPPGGLAVRFASEGAAGIVRPPQPSDATPLPVLVDPATAAGSGGAKRLALSIDGVAIVARVVGVVRRFPALAGDASGFVVAAEPRLAAALDADAPGQGRADELWLEAPHSAGLRRALEGAPFAGLTASFRSDIERRLRTDPVARGVLGTLVAGALLALALAILGMLVAMLGPGRDRALERDLLSQGLGPRALARDLRLRAGAVGLLGVLSGLGVALALTGVAVAAVRSGAGLDLPRPPVRTVLPWAGLAVWGAIVLLGATLAVWVATVTRDRGPR